MNTSDTLEYQMPAQSTSSISVVVPVYNSESTLAELWKRLTETLVRVTTHYEIILVDDGSADESWQSIKALSAKDSHVKGLLHSRNYGQHNALLTGIRYARYDVIITLDDNLQNPPEEVPKLLDKLNEGYDVVYGTPEQERHSFARDLASKLIKRSLRQIMGVKTGNYVSAFRAFRRRLCEVFMNYQHPYIVIDVLLSWATSSFAHLEVKHEYRKSGLSNYSVSRLLFHAVNMITGFSVLPLKLASYIGFFFTLFGIMVLVYVVGRYFALGTSIPGFPFLASIIAIFSGVQLFVLGIIGEYIARIHVRNINQPISALRETVGFGTEPLKISNIAG